MRSTLLACAAVVVLAMSAVPAMASPHRPGPPPHRHGPSWGHPAHVPPHVRHHHYRPPFYGPPPVYRHYYYGPPVYRPYPRPGCGPGGHLGAHGQGFGFYLRF